MTTTREMTVLTNSFHNTEYRTRKTRDEIDAIALADPGRLSAADLAFVRKVRRSLCGIEGCTCGTNEFNER